MNEPMVTISLSEYEDLRAKSMLVKSEHVFTHDGYSHTRIFYDATNERIRSLVEDAALAVRKDFAEHMNKERSRKANRWWR